MVMYLDGGGGARNGGAARSGARARARVELSARRMKNFMKKRMRACRFEHARTAHHTIRKCVLYWSPPPFELRGLSCNANP